MQSDIEREKIQEYLAMDENDLYALLVPETDASLYSEGGRLAHGKQIFASIWRRVHGSVCQEYAKCHGTVDNSLDLAALVAAAIVANPLAYGVPAIPMAAILIKMGLSQLCHGS